MIAVMDGKAVVRIDLNIYDVDAVKRAAYRLLDKFSLSQSGQHLLLELHFPQTPAERRDAVLSIPNC
jgi:hypothetical protein